MLAVLDLWTTRPVITVGGGDQWNVTVEQLQLLKHYTESWSLKDRLYSTIFNQGYMLIILI